jgi:hypothetical protein
LETSSAAVPGTWHRCGREEQHGGAEGSLSKGSRRSANH